MGKRRIERDSMGTVRVPQGALYQAQTQRAVDNFPISGLKMPRNFIRALALIKGSAAKVNAAQRLIDRGRADAIQKAAREVEEGRHDGQFPIDVFQTGSGTSSNMNANEVIATLANRRVRNRAAIHPNDHVNYGQSSNDVIPTAIHVSAALGLKENLLPALRRLERALRSKASSLKGAVKTGRTHLMDAMPLTLGQELGGWAQQIGDGTRRVESALPRIHALALGGTAVGTGINAPKGFGRRVAAELKRRTGIPFKTAPDYFEKLSTQDAAVELSGQLKTVAVSLLKISNDLRWMNSGPNAGLSEIVLPALQPGSSIMPGKVNPVIPEAAAMVCAQVIGNDAAITLGGQTGNFQLNVMLPMIAYNLLQSIEILGHVSDLLADKAIKGFQVNRKNIADKVERNPILVTALNAAIGYEKGAEIAKTAYRDGRRVKDVAAEKTGLSRRKLDALLDPKALTRGGIRK